MSVLPLLPFVAVIIPENCHFGVVMLEFQKFSRGDRSKAIARAQRGLSPPLLRVCRSIPTRCAGQPLTALPGVQWPLTGLVATGRASTGPLGLSGGLGVGVKGYPHRRLIIRAGVFRSVHYVNIVQIYDAAAVRGQHVIRIFL